MTVIRAPLSDRDDSRFHAHAPFSSRFRLRVHRSVRVRFSPFPFFFLMLSVTYVVRTHENRPLSSLVFAKTKRRTNTVTTTLDGINVPVNRAIKRGSTGSKNDGGWFTAFSTSEKIPQITGASSKIDPTQASHNSHSLPTVSLSPVLQPESV